MSTLHGLADEASGLMQHKSRCTAAVTMMVFVARRLLSVCE